MKTTCVPLLILLLLAGCASSTGPSGGEEAVIQTLHDACRAYLEADASRIEALLTPDFTLTDADGVVTTRADDVENARTGGIRYTVFENHDMKVRLHGDAAVVTGVTRVSGTAGATPFTANLQFTDTVVRQNGRWRVASSHISRLPAR
jgi:ketosteroid isomerase-like protein